MHNIRMQTNHTDQRILTATTMNKYSKLNLFGTQGRLGRLIYFLFSFIIPTSIFWIIASIAGQLYQRGIISSQIAYGLILLAFITALAFLIMLTIQRSHDLNKSGWLSVLLLLFPPLISVFWLMPGSKGFNNYREPPQSLPPLAKLISFLLFLGLLIPMIYLLNKFSIIEWLQQLIHQGLAMLPL